MATTPTPPPPKPSTPPPTPPKPDPKPEAARAQGIVIGAKPDDPKDPQSVKFNPPASAPPRWDEKVVEPKGAPDWTPEPALDPLSEKAPAGVYADGMTIAEEQRLRSAWIEEHGMKEYHEAVDQRPADEQPKQVQGVAPPAKRG